MPQKISSANKAKRIAKHKAWKAAHPGAMNGYSRDWIKRNPEKRKAIDAAYNAKRDPVEKRRRAKMDYAVDPQKILKRNKSWRDRNKKTVATLSRAYRQANPEMIAALKRRRDQLAR